MARGWGRNEEDLAAEKEAAREARGSATGGARKSSDAGARVQAHGIRLSLARIEDQLAHTPNPARRQALEAARRELSDRLGGLEDLPGSDDPS